MFGETPRNPLPTSNLLTIPYVVVDNKPLFYKVEERNGLFLPVINALFTLRRETL